MKLITAEELLADAKPIPALLPGFVFEGCLHVMYGASGVGKTHLLIGMGHSIATGRSFAGLPIAGPSSVLYVIAEGFGGIPSRVQAWISAHESCNLERVRYLGEPVAFHLPEGIAELLAALEAAHFRPALVIIDTLAATAPPGFDENSAQHFGEFLHGVGRLQLALGCAALINHHAGWEGSRERGSSAFRGRADVVMSVERMGRSTVKLAVVKARDFQPGDPLLLELVSRGDSVVVERATGAGTLEIGSRTVLAALHESARALKPTEWLNRSGIGKTRFYAIKAELIKRELVAENRDGKWYPTPSGITQLGLEIGSRTVRERFADIRASDCSDSSSSVSGSLRPGLRTVRQDAGLRDGAGGLLEGENPGLLSEPEATRLALAEGA